MGIVTEEEFVDNLRKHLTQDSNKFKKYKYSLSDYTSVIEIDISTEAITLVADLCINAAKVNPAPVSAIVAEQDLIYGLARMAQMLMDETKWEQEVFRNIEIAKFWIKERVKEKYGICDLAFARTSSGH
jgi:hypothetical protein